ncbi:MAG: 16S rRNA (guanine(527)-N(7))-methyltransferase RsmG [Proteobacteria bacterium]|nr:16S rRNA (guanine(527)-N(7))-methyltransferase RsmG [Pseudomonadota bacterium]
MIWLMRPANDERMEIGSKKWKQLIVDGAKNFNIQIDRNQVEQFAVHALELLKWNQKTNLTAITAPAEVAIKHFLDSIIAGNMIDPNDRLLDIGSGGGFPGIPLKIMTPSLSVTLIDASRKKVSFLKHVIRTLKLEKTEARHVRAEDFAKDREIQNRFEVIISRALTSIKDFVLLAAPLLTADGTIIALKGPEMNQELEAVRRRSDQNPTVVEISGIQFLLNMKTYSLPYLELQRTLVSLRIYD